MRRTSVTVTSGSSSTKERAAGGTGPSRCCIPKRVADDRCGGQRTERLGSSGAQRDHQEAPALGAECVCCGESADAEQRQRWLILHLLDRLTLTVDESDSSALFLPPPPAQPPTAPADVRARGTPSHSLTPLTSAGIHSQEHPHHGRRWLYVRAPPLSACRMLTSPAPRTWFSCW